jgi:CheY-like chemotaxis protein
MAMVDAILDAGLFAVEASNADEALSTLRGRPDIVLLVTDVDMPGSLNGAALARKVRLEFPHLDVVVVSGVLPKPDLPDGVLFLGKPLADEVLQDLLGTLVSTGRVTGTDKRHASPHS